jgi:hypothetical protein
LPIEARAAFLNRHASRLKYLQTKYAVCGWACNSVKERNGQGRYVRYFEKSDGLPERIGKAIGDAISLAVVLALVFLVVGNLLK